MIDTMSLEEMRSYKGSHPRPDDFDAFWEDCLSQVSKLPDYNLCQKDFQIPSADFYSLEFKGANGSKIYSKCCFPKSDQPVPVLFYFHGYQGQSPDWSENLKFVAAGCAVVCMDVRGQAGRSTDRGQFDGITVKGQVIRGASSGREHLFYKDVYLDIYQLIEIVASLPQIDEERCYAYGASQGGALAAVAGALNPRIKRVVSIYPFLSDFRRVYALGNNSEPYDELFRYFKFSDPFHQTEKSFFQALDYIDIKNMAARLTCPVHLITGLEDEICPPSTQFAFYNNLTCQKGIQLLPEYGHDALNVRVNDYVFDILFGSRICSSKD